MIFMTHLSNYGNDRLALYTFENVIEFVEKSTNLRLISVKPAELASIYFDMYPPEREAVWRVSEFSDVKQTSCMWHAVIWLLVSPARVRHYSTRVHRRLARVITVLYEYIDHGLIDGSFALFTNFEYQIFLARTIHLKFVELCVSNEMLYSLIFRIPVTTNVIWRSGPLASRASVCLTSLSSVHRRPAHQHFIRSSVYTPTSFTTITARLRLKKFSSSTAGTTSRDWTGTYDTYLLYTCIRNI